MWFYLLFSSILLVLAISFIFDSLSKKEKWDEMLSSSFECGFSSYFFSRYSFSIHYFLVALIFLFLDLELCLIMPFFLDSLQNFVPLSGVFIFAALLVLGLLEEWREGQLEWIT